MSAAREHIAETLLSLMGPAPRAVADGDWPAITAMAAEHRLVPHLHARLGRGELDIVLPDALREEWAVAARASAMEALAHRAELKRLIPLLEGAGFAPVALKGAWLAWHAYPQAGERPVRDIDLLLPGGQAREAQGFLLGEGYTLLPTEGDPHAQDATPKHEAPLLAPSGVLLELHRHAWDPPGVQAVPGPALADAAIAARAVREDGIAYPVPADMFAHLVTHAAYSHRFDVGPLLLADIDYLLDARPLDWPAIWVRADEERWQRGAALVLALVERWRRPGVLAESGCPVAVEDSAVEAASRLLTQPLGARQDAGIASAVGQAWQDTGIAGVARLAADRLARPGAASRIVGAAGSMAKRSTRATAADATRVDRWLAEVQ